MTLRRRDRFAELLERQLDLFTVDELELLQEAEEAERNWNDSGREGAEEAYGDYQLVVDALADRLLEIRDTYAGSLDDEAAGQYRKAFTREATRRFRRYASVLADLDDA